MDICKLKEDILKGDRRRLGQAITFIESKKSDLQSQQFEFLQGILPHAGHSIRIGVSGTPGVGKSTFIESFGLYAINKGHRVAVLAIDPSSSKSYGSILGDKTRMTQLASHPQAFIRPSPSGGVLGGVSHHTRETILLCEAAGFDLILVETVGVGQSEAKVVDMVDTSLLLLSPGGGDQIQAMKKGLLEAVDMIIINKADGELKALAYQMAAEFSRAFQLSPQESERKILLCSALEPFNINAIYESIITALSLLQKKGKFSQNRHQQDIAWFWEKVEYYLMERFKRERTLSNKLEIIKDKIHSQTLLPSLAAYQIVERNEN